jgi:signal transduction histidine kinase
VGVSELASEQRGGNLIVTDDALDERERRLDSLIDRFLPYLGLAIGTALTPLVVPASASYWLVTGALVAAAAAWSAGFARWVPHCGAAAAHRAGAVYMIGYLALMAALVYQSPFYGFQAIGGYLQAIIHLRGGWRWAGVLAVAGLVAYSQLGGGFADHDLTPALVAGWLGIMLVNAAVGGGFTYFGTLTARQSERRREIIEELNDANRRLSETLQENADLHAQLVAQAREAGVLDERARLAREIHDTLAQGLTGIVTQLEAAGAADGDVERSRRHLDTAVALARESLAEARRSVDALAPGQLAAAALPDAVAEMAKRWAEAAGVDLILDTTGDPRPLLLEIEATLFRVAQEALTNTAKHASATRVGLTLSYMDDVVVLDVRDDGRGFVVDGTGDGRPAGRVSAAPASDGSGFGLAAMEQRIRRVAGTLAVESPQGEGTAVSASVPAIPAEVRA